MTRTTGTRWVIACATVLVLLGGCGGASEVTDPNGEPSPTVEPSTSADEPTTATFTTPQTEDPGRTEDPDGGGGDDEVAVDLPGLPIGGFHEVDPVDPTVRCVVVNFSGPPDLVPPEANLEITGLAVEPAGAYGWAADGCNGFGPCLDSPGVLDAGGQCGVRVDQVATVPDGTGALSVTSGSIDCATEARAVCEQFAAEVEAAPPDTIEWDDALTEWVPDMATTTEASTTGTPTTIATETTTTTETSTIGSTGAGTDTTSAVTATTKATPGEVSTSPDAPTSTG